MNFINSLHHDFPSPLMDLDPFMKSDKKKILFSKSQLYVGFVFCQLIERILNYSEILNLNFIFPVDSSSEYIGIESCAELRELLSSDEFLSDFYFFDNNDNLFAYHSARDDFLVIAVNESFVSSVDLKQWDERFATHLNSAGVGFGDAGKMYIRELLAPMPKIRKEILLKYL